MFDSAARQHLAWSCLVGGGSGGDLGDTNGLGCSIGPNHILAARHSSTDICDRYSWPSVFKADGLFRCEVAFESTEHDLMILRTVARIVAAHPCGHSDFPLFFNALPSPGTQVEFIARRVTCDDGRLDELHRYRVHGTVSAFLPHGASQLHHFLLNDVVYQAGSSGAAVFLADGSIAGVLIRGLPVQTNEPSDSGEWHHFPLVTSIAPLIDQIHMILGDAYLIT